MMPKAMSNLEERLGYRFENIKLLETALTHSSYSNEMRTKKCIVECNERLEFLGDSVLSLLSSEYLYRRYPALSEGELSRMRSTIVCL